MARPIVDGRAGKLLQRPVVALVVVPEGFHAERRPFFIKEAPRQQHPHSMNPVIDRKIGSDLEMDTESPCRLDPRSSRSELAHLNIVRGPVLAVDVPLLT